MSAPYRTGEVSPKFICIACYRTASALEGTCSRCGSPRISLDNPQVIEDLRKHAMEVKDKRDTRGALFLGVPLFALAIGVYLLLGWLGWVDIRPHSSDATWRYQLVNIPVFVTVCFVVIGAGMVLTRRKENVVRNPMTMNSSELLDFLHMKIEG